MDVGQQNANALWQQAVSGTFRMERGTAEECAKAYTRLVDTVLVELIERSDRLSDLSGFGGFSSAEELRAGFEAKGEATREALVGIQEAALRMAAAFLQAAGAFDEADAMNKRAIEAAWKGPEQ